MELNNIVGLDTAHQDLSPLWAKFSKNDRQQEERAFLLFQDGAMYNYFSDENSEQKEWNNWGKIDSNFVQQISELIVDLDKHLENNNTQKSGRNASTISIQYTLDETVKKDTISKNYSSTDGQYLKKINDLVNKALADRNKNKH